MMMGKKNGGDEDSDVVGMGQPVRPVYKGPLPVFGHSISRSG